MEQYKSNRLYEFRGEPPRAGSLIPLSLQHVLAAILFLAGLIPNLSAALTTIPQCVIGGATVSVFAVITMTGIRIFTKDGFDNRKSTIVGISVALGVGVTQVSGSLSGPGMPAWIHTVFGSSSVVIATIVAILLNLVLPRDKEKETGESRMRAAEKQGSRENG